MMFIYQCVNKKQKLNLMVENEKEAKDFLENRKIDIKIFDKFVSKEDMKNEINNKSILISNDESLKNNLRREKGINCFASNFVEALIDWKA